MKIYTSDKERGPDQCLYWEGPGWYGTLQTGNCVNYYRIDGYDSMDATTHWRRGNLGTPVYLGKPDQVF